MYEKRVRVATPKPINATIATVLSGSGKKPKKPRELGFDTSPGVATRAPSDAAHGWYSLAEWTLRVRGEGFVSG